LPRARERQPLRAEKDDGLGGKETPKSHLQRGGPLRKRGYEKKKNKHDERTAFMIKVSGYMRKKGFFVVFVNKSSGTWNDRGGRC